MNKILLALMIAVATAAVAAPSRADVSPAQTEDLRSRILLLNDDLNEVRTYLKYQNLSPNSLQREQEVAAWNIYSSNLVILKRAVRVEDMRGAASPLWSDIMKLKRIEKSGLIVRSKIVQQAEGDDGLADVLDGAGAGSDASF